MCGGDLDLTSRQAPIASFSLSEFQFNSSYSPVNLSVAIIALGLVISPPFTSALVETYGRTVVMMASTAVALVASGCTSISEQTIGGCMAARFFQGFGAGPGTSARLAIINNSSWEHEHDFRIGVWAMSIKHWKRARWFEYVPLRT
jgi:MFS family permease